MRLILAYTFFLIVLAERIASTFTNQKKYNLTRTPVETGLTYGLILLYASVFFTGFARIHGREAEINIWMTSAGVLIWFCAVAARRSAIHAMGSNWSVFRTPLPHGYVTTIGPYKYSRHPYYLSTVVELISYCLIFNSIQAFLVVLCIYIPLAIVRSLREEALLTRKHGSVYTNYKQSTPFIFSAGKFLGRLEPINLIGQLARLAGQFGPAHILKVLFLDQTVKRYFRNYSIYQCVFALSRVGLTEELKVKGSVRVDLFCKSHRLNYRTLKIVCDYLSVVKVLKKEGLNYRLSRYGRRLCDDSIGVLYFMHAYAPVFENLEALIKGDKRYGDPDVFRRGEYVGRASAELAEHFPFPIARSIIKKYGFTNILDLGSGSGDFLIGFCRSGMSGYGVDLSAEAVAYANQKASEAGVNDRARFIIGDITKLDDLNLSNDPVDLVTCMFVLHEFVSDGDEFVVELFKNIKIRFPEAKILVCELTKCDFNELSRTGSSVAEHHLFHALSDQGLVSEDQWRRIFDKAGLKVVEEERIEIGRQNVYLLQ